MLRGFIGVFLGAIEGEIGGLMRSVFFGLVSWVIFYDWMLTFNMLSLLDLFKKEVSWRLLVPFR